MPGERSRLLRLQQEFPVSYALVPKTAAYAMAVRDTVVKVDPTAGAFTITLPPVAEAAGSHYVIKQIASQNTTTIVDKGDAVVVISRGLASTTAVALYYSDGEQWYLMYSAA